MSASENGHTGAKNLTDAERKFLEPFAKHYASIIEEVELMTDEDLALLVEASARVSTTNCWWATYGVAPIVAKAAKGEISLRAYKSLGAS